MVEPALPEAGHLARPIDQRGERTELCAVVRQAAFRAIAHQARLLQHTKVLRDGGLRDPGVSRQGSDRLLAFPAQAFEKSPPRRIGKRPEEHVVDVRHR